jgi:dUTP pyrophosphatase
MTTHWKRLFDQLSPERQQAIAARAAVLIADIMQKLAQCANMEANVIVEVVGVKKLRESVELPLYQTEGAAGFDLAASEPVTVEPKSLALVPTGLVFAVPDGYFLGIFARSSTPKKGLFVANGVGILDADYCGPKDEAKILVYNYTDQPINIAINDRLAQGVILPAAKAMFVELEHEDDAQSRGGFGSTDTPPTPIGS